jgi:hypothetical protein
MDFPQDWTALAAGIRDGHARDERRRHHGGDAQLRPSGPILDNFRLALAGSKALEFNADLFALIPAPGGE